MAIGDNTEKVENEQPECFWCGDNFDPSKSDATDKRFCSANCETEFSNEEEEEEFEEEDGV